MDNFTHTGSRLASLEVFPPAQSYVYLDAASVGLTHKGAAEAINRWQTQLADDGTVAFDEEAEVKCFDELNAAAAELFNATPADIAVASSETVLMSSLAWAAMPKRGSTIVATAITHPSTVYPWVRVAQHTGAEMRWVKPRDRLTIDMEELLGAIDDDTSIVCISHVEYGTGQTYDLKTIADKAHRHGALCVVDGTQSAGQVEVDAAGSGVDAVATSTYKWLCGPFGTGLMYVSPRMQEMNPGLLGWRSHKDMWDFQADRLELPKGAKRYEFGTMAYGTAIGATVGLRYLLDIGVRKIQEHNSRISAQLIEGLRELGAQVLGPADPSRRSATVAARFAGKNSAEFARTLKQNNVIASLRKDFIRFSPHFYNSSDDIRRGLAAIQAAL